MTHYQRWRWTREGRSNRARLASLRGLHSGKRGFVIGNGPSLKKFDVNLLAGEITVASNAHFLMWDQLDYRPTFYTAEDPLVTEDRAPELSSLTGTSRIFPFDAYERLGPAGPDKMYLNFPRRYYGFPRFSWDLARVCYWGGTVSFLNLQLAAYVGCNPIYLVGFDHSYALPHDQPEGELVIESKEEDVNHFHPGYFGPGYRWHDPNLPRMETAFACARDACAARGIRILNATVGGHLEVFERVDIRDVLGGPVATTA